MSRLKRGLFGQRYWLSVAMASLLFGGCGRESPTAPTTVTCINTTYLLANEQSYEARQETATDHRGHLIKNCPAGATYCYYLDSMPINPGDKAALLDPFAGKEVIVVAKSVNVSGGTELWPAAVCQLQCDDGAVPCLR